MAEAPALTRDEAAYITNLAEQQRAGEPLTPRQERILGAGRALVPQQGFQPSLPAGEATQRDIQRSLNELDEDFRGVGEFLIGMLPGIGGASVGLKIARGLQTGSKLVRDLVTGISSATFELGGQLSGLLPNSDFQIGLEAVAPALGSSTVRVGKTIIRNLPGAPVVMQELSTRLARTLPRRLIPRGRLSASRLYDQIEIAGNPRIKIPRATEAALALRQEQSLEQLVAPGTSRRVTRESATPTVKDLQQLIADFDGEVPFSALRSFMRVVKKRMKNINRDSQEFAELQRIRGSIQDDLNAAAKDLPDKNAAELLNAANRVQAIEFSRDDLAAAIMRSLEDKETPGGLVKVFTPRKVLKWLDDTKNKDAILLRKTLGKDGTAKIRDTLQKMAREFPVMEVQLETAGAALGTSRRVAFTAAGFMAGEAIGQETGIFGFGGALGAAGVAGTMDAFADALVFNPNRFWHVMRAVVKASRAGVDFGERPAILLAATAAVAMRPIFVEAPQGRQDAGKSQ